MVAVSALTYLDMVKRLVSELGTELPTKVTSVTITPVNSYGTTTQHINDCVTWIKQAWIELQEDQTDWDFMRKQGIFSLVAGQAQYDIALQDNLEDYDGIRPFVAINNHRYVWLTDGSVSPSTRHPCYYVPSENFFGFFNRTPVASGQSNKYTFTSNGCVLLHPPPGSDSMSLEFRYQRATEELVEDTDTPTGLPPKYHMSIVYKAMEYYSGYDETQPQWARSAKLRKKMMNKMYIELLPEYTVVGVR